MGRHLPHPGLGQDAHQQQGRAVRLKDETTAGPQERTLFLTSEGEEQQSRTPGRLRNITDRTAKLEYDEVGNVGTFRVDGVE
ncbi:hypothetical protein ACIQRW_06180 [Streptomyces sp. NPDC091287]|uniref:hypothetical protein n=1 Tax=Streptomyces sp. NPDC091287 TaxID=3365988 RepID=UPI00381667F4